MSAWICITTSGSYTFGWLYQGLLATTLAFVFKSKSWWRYIHFFFPAAIGICSEYPIPNEFYLLFFLLSLSVFWTTCTSQVPFYPSSPAIWQQVADLLPENTPCKIIDIGSGIGGLCLSVAKHKPESIVTGIEIAPLPWLISVIRSKYHPHRTKFLLGSYYQLNFATYDIVFAYLSPAAMPAIWEKAKNEMRESGLFISYEFAVPDVMPSQVFTPTKNSPSTYLYRLPAITPNIIIKPL
jgi:hypothetical protein